jgi:hypothetical protein
VLRAAESDLDRANGDIAPRQHQKGLSLVLEQNLRLCHDLRSEICNLRKRNDARGRVFGRALRQRAIVGQKLVRRHQQFFCFSSTKFFFSLR